jgi:pyruvate/2-oxoglutarate dehydrogenase complex dihydrolipoamide acyltransferase (E2) component
MNTDATSNDVPSTSMPFEVEDRTLPAAPERVRIRLDGLGVVIGMEAQTAGASHLVVTSDLPFLRLGSRLEVERAANSEHGEAGPQRGTLDWVALDISGDTRTPRLQLGLGLDPQGSARPGPARHARGWPMAGSAAPAPSVASPPRRSIGVTRRLWQRMRRWVSHRWLGRVVLVALGVGVGATLARWDGGSSADSPLGPPRTARRTPAPVSAGLLASAMQASPAVRAPSAPRGRAKEPRSQPAARAAKAEAARAEAARAEAAESKAEAARAAWAARAARAVRAGERRPATRPRSRWARRAAAKRARARALRIRRYLARARRALRRRRFNEAWHLARLVLILDPNNAHAAAILGRRRGLGG